MFIRYLDRFTRKKDILIERLIIIRLLGEGKHPATHRAKLLAALTYEALELASKEGIDALLHVQKEVVEHPTPGT